MGRNEGATATGVNTPTKSFFARWTSSAAASAKSLRQPSETAALLEDLDLLDLVDRQLDDEVGGNDGPMGTVLGEFFGSFVHVFGLGVGMGALGYGVLDRVWGVLELELSSFGR